ncbi:MAG TPA: SDR family NAD(P)-dependent oxidoreductase [Bryobacteraceae bacterium]|nr:SDR family NAD(P)-dependent oxidoreductase [Bryobacteraceae bacterium]
MRVRDKVAIVTGGASGIGAATAKLLAQEGARVAILDTHPAVEPPFDDAVSLRADVRSESEVQSAIEEVARRFGCVDVLVNNAGIAIRQAVAEADEASWTAVVDVNVKGAFLCSKHALRFMPRFGSIVHMSSVVGITGVRDRGAYSAAKGALVALTRNMAIDYADRQIRVNCICPGFVKTPFIQGLIADSDREKKLTAMHPIGRLGEPEDIAKAVLFLASDDASWITGHALVVDGGFSAGHAI